MRSTWLTTGFLILALGALDVQGQTRATGRVLSTADIAERATPATATIIAIGSGGDTLGQGSGFVVRNDGFRVRP